MPLSLPCQSAKVSPNGFCLNLLCTIHNNAGPTP